MFNSINWRDLIERAAWTFLQGFAAAWLVTEDPQFDINALVGAAGAGLSAVKTLIVTWLQNRR